MPNKFGENDKKPLSIAIIKEYGGGRGASLCSFFVPLSSTKSTNPGKGTTKAGKQTT